MAAAAAGDVSGSSISSELTEDLAFDELQPYKDIVFIAESGMPNLVMPEKTWCSCRTNGTY